LYAESSSGASEEAVVKGVGGFRLKTGERAGTDAVEGAGAGESGGSLGNWWSGNGHSCSSASSAQ